MTSYEYHFCRCVPVGNCPPDREPLPTTNSIPPPYTLTPTFFLTHSYHLAVKSRSLSTFVWIKIDRLLSHCLLWVNIYSEYNMSSINYLLRQTFPKSAHTAVWAKPDQQKKAAPTFVDLIIPAVANIFFFCSSCVGSGEIHDGSLDQTPPTTTLLRKQYCSMCQPWNLNGAS